LPSRHRAGVRRLLLLALTAVVVAACSADEEPSGEASGEAPAAVATDERGCVTDPQPGVDYFPDKSDVRHAENFSIAYEDTYQVLTVEEPFPDGPPESYVLVRCGAPEPELPAELADAPQVEVPIRSLFAASTTHVPLVEDLEVLDVLTGIATADYVVSEAVRDRIASGAVTEFAPSEQLDTELVTAEQPDVFMTGGFEDPGFDALRNAGVNVVANAEWLEDTPLGRAEWLKVMAALTGTEAEAAEVFDGVEARYQEVADAAAGVEEPVEVLTGSMFQGSWTLTSGNFFETLLRDAGATHPWADEPGGDAASLDFESVFARAGDVRTWLTTENWATLADAAAAEARYAELAAFRDGEVWSNTKVVGPGGGSAFWEQGVTRPDEILADLVAILHPELLPDHDFSYYRQVPRS
jgi:iron complex transport system substrate-binding protein